MVDLVENPAEAKLQISKKYKLDAPSACKLAEARKKEFLVDPGSQPCRKVLLAFWWKDICFESFGARFPYFLEAYMVVFRGGVT